MTVIEGLGGGGKTPIVPPAGFDCRSCIRVPATDLIGFEKAYASMAERLGIQVTENGNAGIIGTKMREGVVSYYDNADVATLLLDQAVLASYRCRFPLVRIPRVRE